LDPIVERVASKIEKINESPIKYIRNCPSSRFVLSPVRAVRASKVSELFSNLNTNKASINIPNTLIKIVAKQLLSIPFTYIYNKSFETGIVPDVQKISRITPIYKYGTCTDPFNYRPISILSPFSKILEKLIYEQLISFIEKI
jgi:hypothetical protein